MSRRLRIFILLLTSGLLWYLSFYAFFILSNAQRILANPIYQSSKFLKVFTELEPLPRMAQDGFLIYKGFYLIGTLSLLAFLFLNDRLRGNWYRKAISFGVIQWVMMIPWFEFYLPYNVMHEPFTLVLLEGVLWLGTILTVSCANSFIMNYKPRI